MRFLLGRRIRPCLSFLLPVGLSSLWHEKMTWSKRQTKKEYHFVDVKSLKSDAISFRPDPSSSPKERRVIFGADDRKKLPPGGKAQLKPHSSACKVTCRGFCSWSCSGVLIGSRHVLTSAHCVDSVTTGAVLVGFLERNGRFQWYNVMEVFIPSGWQASKAITDDYAVLKLRRSTNRPHLSVSYVPLSKKSVIAITG